MSDNHEEDCPIFVLAGPLQAAAFIAHLSGMTHKYAELVLDYLNLDPREMTPEQRETAEMKLRETSVALSETSKATHDDFCRGDHIGMVVVGLTVVDVDQPAQQVVDRNDWTETDCANPACDKKVVAPPNASMMQRCCSTACAMAMMTK